MASNANEDTTERDNTGQGMYSLDAQGWRQRAEEIFKEMPPPSIQPLPKDDVFKLSNYNNQPDCNAAEAAQKCAEVIEKYDANSCKAHREEIDTLLVFAGLFSAVVTAFTIESYQWLQSDPNDAIIALLSQIVHGNQSQALPEPTGLPDAVSARINAYWFLSLTMSLASALIAILCKQWVREFERRGDQTPEVFISVRQTKLEGFESWGVASVVAAIPLLLQSALGLFALGLIELLWILHTAVAIVVLVPTLAALIFYGSTTLLPGLQLFCDPYSAHIAISQCPFKSPQALLTLRMLAFLWRHSSCPQFIYIPFEFFYRHCVVFCRRVYACFCPDYLSRRYRSIGPTVPLEDVSHGRARHRLWRRLRAPWQYPELKFYERSVDRPSWRSFCRWWRKHLPFNQRSQDRVAGMTLRERVLYPRFPYDSWAVLDRNFAQARDNVTDYTRFHPDEGGQLPPQSYFRGLAWLHKQIDHPGLLEWVWVAVWDLAVRAEMAGNMWRIPDRPRHGEEADNGARAQELAAEAERTPRHQDALHFGHAMRSLFGITLYEDTKSSQPIALALYFGIVWGMNPAVLGELFVHILPHLKLGIAPYMWGRLRQRLGNQQDIWHSALHAVLVQLLCNDPWSRSHGPTFLFTLRETESHSWDRSLGPDWNRMTHSELACVIALRFRELRSLGGDSVDRDELPHGLVDATLTAAADSQGSPHCSAVVQSTFSALALEFDRWLEQSSAQGSLGSLPNKWFHAQYRSVYFDLLRHEESDLGSPSSSVSPAEARLVRQLFQIEEVRRVRERNRPSPDSWDGDYEYVMGWPALRDAVFDVPDSTEEAHGPSASTNESEPSEA